MRLTKCNPHGTIVLGAPPREHPEGPPEPSLLFCPGFGTLPFPGRPFIRLPVSEGGGPGPQQSRDAPAWLHCEPGTGRRGVFATVPTVQTGRQKSEEGIISQDQAQSSRFHLFTEPTCSQQRDAGGNMRGRVEGQPLRTRTFARRSGVLDSMGVSSRGAWCSCTCCQAPLGCWVWITGLLTVPGAPSLILPRPAVLRGGQQPQRHVSSARPRACPRPGSWELFGWGPMTPPRSRPPRPALRLAPSRFHSLTRWIWASPLSRARL